MRRYSFLICLITALALTVCTASCSKKKDDTSSTDTSTGTNPTGTGTGPTGTGTTPGPGGDLGALFYAINNDRTSSGLSPLSYNSSLAAVAQAYADYLSSNKIKSYSPTADGSSPEGRIGAAGITFVKAGEAGIVSSSAKDASTAFQYLQQYYGSTLSDPDFNEAGVGYATASITSTG